MLTLREIAKKVREQGEVKSTGGVSVASRHAINVIKAVDHLIKTANEKSRTTLITASNDPMHECSRALHELREAAAGQIISDGARELLGSSAAEILEDEIKMTPATRAVLNDVVYVSMLNTPTLMPELKTDHYEQQFNARAQMEGANFRFRGAIARVTRPG